MGELSLFDVEREIFLVDLRVEAAYGLLEHNITVVDINHAVVLGNVLRRDAEPRHFLTGAAGKSARQKDESAKAGQLFKCLVFHDRQVPLLRLSLKKQGG